MIGKKNIVFGLLYLVATASLGPYIIKELRPATQQAAAAKQKALGTLQQLKQDNFEKDLEPMKAADIARVNSAAILALSDIHNARTPVDGMKGGPHAHGNLEALLNVVAGLVLMFLAAPKLVKHAISWLFILGAVLHSGMLFLRAFEVSWASTLLVAGPWLVLLALLSLGVASCLWLRPEIARDN